MAVFVEVVFNVEGESEKEKKNIYNNHKLYRKFDIQKLLHGIEMKKTK